MHPKRRAYYKWLFPPSLYSAENCQLSTVNSRSSGITFAIPGLNIFVDLSGESPRAAGVERNSGSNPVPAHLGADDDLVAKKSKDF